MRTRDSAHLFVRYLSASLQISLCSRGRPQKKNRTLTCTVTNGVDTCSLTAPDTKIKNLDLNIECKREPTDDGKKQRLACPIRCPKDYEVHVLNKIPSSNRKCTKYFTYGKYPGEKEW
uniref:DUF7808 domain-containing protein n=1 Tax=Caenorhabditis japonica TaxID=281687 RepID=A0A8R1DHT9_CAEJA